MCAICEACPPKLPAPGRRRLICGQDLRGSLFCYDCGFGGCQALWFGCQLDPAGFVGGFYDDEAASRCRLCAFWPGMARQTPGRKIAAAVERELSLREALGSPAGSTGAGATGDPGAKSGVRPSGGDGTVNTWREGAFLLKATRTSHICARPCCLHWGLHPLTSGCCRRRRCCGWARAIRDRLSVGPD
jgi:hypothetical protein